MSDHEHEFITVESQGDIAIIRLNRPKKLNALTADARVALVAQIRQLGDGTAARGIVLTGTGQAFCAGEDLSETLSGGPEDAADGFNDITRAILSSKVPIAAAVNGIAIGGSAEMLLGVDTRIGCPDARFLMPENARGLVISNAASLLLFRLLKGSDVYRVIVDGAELGADEALGLGLLDEVVPTADVVEATVDKLERWTEHGAATMQHLRLLRPPLEEVERAMRLETDELVDAWNAGLVQRGVEAFLARRR